MFKFYNPHPKGLRVNDCVKRALTIATGKPYNLVSLELNRLKKITGCKSYNNKNNWKEYINLLGWKKMPFPAEAGKPRMNGFQFTTNYPHGTFILSMAHHLSVCKNGVILDTWDCRHKCIYNAWEVR